MAQNWREDMCKEKAIKQAWEKNPHRKKGGCRIHAFLYDDSLTNNLLSFFHRIPHLEQLRLQVSRITMFDYEQHHYDKEKLRSTSSSIGLIMIDQDADLEQVRVYFSYFFSFFSFIVLHLDILWSA